MSSEVQFLLYNLPEEALDKSGQAGSVQVVVKDETIWCTQKAMAQLFGVQRPAITKHLANIFKEGELEEQVVCSNLELTTAHGAIAGKTQTSLTKFYNLDAIISVGYRVSSPRATKFRQWATKILNEYVRKGFVLDDNRMKQGTALLGKDYFSELLERVRSIRASERRIWQQITDIYAECSIDYDRNAPTTREFYAMIQNRFHYAITGKTAAEIIYTQADHTQDHMGLTTWKNAPDGRVLKSDVSIAKNYLQEKEIRQLERTITAYFDYIENQIERQNAFTMEQFSASVDKFLTFNDYRILPDKGRISAEQAKKKAESEYDIFNKTQRIDSDFDKQIKGMLAGNYFTNL
ncbi:MAG: virulence RhuM family protein [Paludibacteraceae bacterium]|nr:virulence RhuM family protein [Paludibacteraceae bacterium]